MDLMGYLPALISLVSGVLAFFFAKSGEQNRVSGVGWALAALLVGGGLVGLYVLYDKEVSAAEAKAQAALEADKAAVASAKQSALVMTLIGDFDLKQTIPEVSLQFEFSYDTEGNPEIPAGLIGPFPVLPAGATGSFKFEIGDVASYVAQFRSDGEGRLLLIGETGGVYEFTNTDVALRNPRPERENNEDREEEAGAAAWMAGPEPAPFGFLYQLSLPTDVQLRRLLYAMVVQEPFGYVRFPKGSVSTHQLEKIEKHFAANPPLLNFFIPGPEGGPECHSYVHVRLRLVPPEEPMVEGAIPFDGFEIRLTPDGFAPDPCNPYQP